MVNPTAIAVVASGVGWADFWLAVLASLVAPAIGAVIVACFKRAAIVARWQRLCDKRRQVRAEVHSAITAKVAREDFLDGIPHTIVKFLHNSTDDSLMQATERIMARSGVSRRVAERRAGRAFSTAIEIWCEEYRTSTRRRKLRLVLRPAHFHRLFFLPAGVHACMYAHNASAKARLSAKAASDA